MYAELLHKEVKQVLQSYGGVDLNDPNVFIANLVFLYHCTRASEHLLSSAIFNEKTKALTEFYRSHLEEEKGHCAWLKEDLASVGVDVSKTLIPSSAVELCGSLYYLIFHVDPAALLGYQLMMECFPPSLKLVETLEQRYGTPFLRTIRYPAEHDVGHGEKILQMIESVDKSRLWVISQTAIKSAHYFGQGIAGVINGRS